MEVILSKDVPKLGKLGDVVKVKSGFARNLLFPKKLAYAATGANLKRIELQKKKRQEELQKQKQEAQQLSDKLSKASCTISAEANDREKLYGSVTEVEIVKALEVEGFVIDKNSIQIEKPIEELGIFEVNITLHPEVTSKVRVWVTKK